MKNTDINLRLLSLNRRKLRSSSQFGMLFNEFTDKLRFTAPSDPSHNDPLRSGFDGSILLEYRRLYKFHGCLSLDVVGRQL